MGKEQTYRVGFDLGGTKMFAGVFDSSFRLVASKRRKTKGYEGQEVGLERMRNLIAQVCEEAGLSPSELAGIGVGCPGPLDLKKGVMIEAANLGWSKVPLKEHLERTFGCPAAIGNDVDVGVLGEYYAGAGRNGRCVLGVFPGTGIGGGCVMNGRNITGGTFSCMEFGHMKVLPGGPLCGCGDRGCLEAVASRLAIAAEAIQAAYRGQAPHLKELAGSDLEKVRSGTLRKSVAAGDLAVEQIIRRAARWLGLGVANLVNLIAPDIVVLGGGLVEALPDLFAGEVETAARQHAMPSFKKSFRVAIAQLGDEAGIYGAARMVADQHK